MSDARRRLPSVNALLEEAERAGLLETSTRGALVAAVRAVVSQARRDGTDRPGAGWIDAVRRTLEEQRRLSLRSVVNATGVVLHTNLGRAPLAEAARLAVQGAFRYSALEFDLDTGKRGSRQGRARQLLREITGAEDAVVVTNAAAAVLLAMNTLADDGETIVSRGELVEIGGAFRIPEILAKSGSTLVEVGTTNRTRLRDYESALSPRTKLLLKVHRSNFELRGFVEETSVADLVQLGCGRGIPAVHDLGSGLLVDLSAWGLRGEPTVQSSVACGATVIFSGDKLVGGPQAGIVVGPKAVIARAAKNPLARAMRPDKITFAALEATLALYRDPDAALKEIPVLAMLTAPPEELRRRAGLLAAALGGAPTVEGTSAVGGGAFPGADLATTLVHLPCDHPDAMLEAFRRHDPPIVARAGEGGVLLDPRTLQDGDIDAIAAAWRAHGRA